MIKQAICFTADIRAETHIMFSSINTEQAFSVHHRVQDLLLLPIFCFADIGFMMRLTMILLQGKPLLHRQEVMRTVRVQKTRRSMNPTAQPHGTAQA